MGCVWEPTAARTEVDPPQDETLLLRPQPRTESYHSGWVAAASGIILGIGMYDVTTMSSSRSNRHQRSVIPRAEAFSTG